MRLQRTERDNYVVTYDTDPVLSGTVQASFDEGETWIDGFSTDDAWAWLVAGPDFDAAENGLDEDDTAATIESTTRPLLRLKDDPVLDVARAPKKIRLWP